MGSYYVATTTSSIDNNTAVTASMDWHQQLALTREGGMVESSGGVRPDMHGKKMAVARFSFSVGALPPLL